MNKIFFIVLLTLTAKLSLGQQTMENYLLKDIGSISIPTNMELQNNNKTGSEFYPKEAVRKSGFEASNNRVVFQEKAIDADVKNEYSTYARVILKTTLGNEGDFEKLTTKLAMTPAELATLDAQLKSEIEQSFTGTGVKLVSWYGIRIMTVNGRTALNVSYLRQLDNQPHVTVSIYQFNNNDRVHKLTLSYTSQDAVKWSPLFSKILTSFTITNVR